MDSPASNSQTQSSSIAQSFSYFGEKRYPFCHHTLSLYHLIVCVFASTSAEAKVRMLASPAIESRDQGLSVHR